MSEDNTSFILAWQFAINETFKKLSEQIELDIKRQQYKESFQELVDDKKED